MARKGDNIYRRKNGRWEAKYPREKVDGRIRYGYVSGASYEEVLEKKKEAIKKLEESQKEKSLPDNALLFSSLASEWLAERESRLKKTTLCKYRNNLNLHLIPVFGERKIDEITTDDLGRLLIRLTTTGGRENKGISGSSAKSILSVFRSIAEYARDRKNAHTASFRGLGIKDKNKPIRVLSLQEQHALEKYLIENISTDNDLIGILLCLYTGIRLGELCALRWEDIRLDERELFIGKTMARIQTPNSSGHKTEVLITMPKSDCSVRRIQIPKKMHAILCSMKGPQETYFLTGQKEKYVEPRTMENHFKSAVHAAGIKNVNFHALRHTFATRCVELGFDVKTLSEILGHSSVRITMDRYVHPTKATKQKYMDMLSDIMTVF